MKILGVNRDQRWTESSTFIVQCGYAELHTILGVRDPLNIAIGQELPVCANYRQALDVQQAAASALRVPATLRSIADCLEMASDSIKSIEAAGRPKVETTEEEA